jgi:hypothetical protein
LLLVVTCYYLQLTNVNAWVNEVANQKYLAAYNEILALSTSDQFWKRVLRYVNLLLPVHAVQIKLEADEANLWCVTSNIARLDLHLRNLAAWDGNAALLAIMLPLWEVRCHSILTPVTVAADLFDPRTVERYGVEQWNEGPIGVRRRDAVHAVLDTLGKMDQLLNFEHYRLRTCKSSHVGRPRQCRTDARRLVAATRW